MKVKRKRKRKARHDKACQLAGTEGKPQPATPESSEEDEEETSDAEDHSLGRDGAAAGASPLPTYERDADEGAPVAAEETRAAGSARPSHEGAERESSPQAAGKETPEPQADARGAAVSPPREQVCTLCRALPSSSSSSRPLPPPCPSTFSSSPRVGG